MNIISVSSEELQDRLNTPFNPPSLSGVVTREMFHLEWHEVRNGLKKVLDQFGRWDAYGEGDYFLDDIVALSRGIGVEITNCSMLTEYLVRAIQDFLAGLDQAYEIDLSFNSNSGFYDMFVSCDTVVTDWSDTFKGYESTNGHNN